MHLDQIYDRYPVFIYHIIIININIILPIHRSLPIPHPPPPLPPHDSADQILLAVATLHSNTLESVSGRVQTLTMRSPQLVSSACHWLSVRSMPE